MTMSRKGIMALLAAVALATSNIPVAASVSGNDAIQYEGAGSISDSDAVSGNEAAGIAYRQGGIVIFEVKTCSNEAEKNNTMDGDTETFWTSKDKHTPDNRHYWECTFDQSYSLKEINLTLGRKASNGSWGFVPNNLRVELLRNGTYELAEEYTQVSEVMLVTLPEETSAEGVRISFLDTAPKGFSIREISFAEAQEEEKQETVTPNTEKKVYADYHGPRYTRELDGNVGNWGYAGLAGNTATGQSLVVRNPDLILEDGTRQLAASAYPLAGMQSQMNQDYQEYQILLAKMANIDGFFIEWGYPGHGTDKQLELMMEVAQKYDFELGVNWCDGWHLKSWITNIKPEVITREQKVEEAVHSLSEILDKLYASPVGALYNDHPLVYLFGDGFTKAELAKVTGEAAIPEKFTENEPWYFRRASLAGTIDGEGKASFNYAGGDWHEVVEGPFGWIPDRIRNAVNDGIPGFDRYGTKEDALAYLEALRKAQTVDPSIPMRNSVVAPGMDNRSCAGWGDRFKFLDREGGELYRELWKYNVEYRDYLDVVYIATWNDYTEGTQIEPTVEDGFRELLTTQQYAYEFKGEGNLDSSGMYLPGQLLELRSEARRLQKIGFTVDGQQEILDRAGLAISDGRYDEAASLLEEAGKMLKAYEVTRQNIICSQDKGSFTVAFGEPEPPLPAMENVALHKPVTANTQLNSTSGPELAVDGSYALDSRWRTPSDIDEHWLEIDLQGEYEICAAALYMGDATGWPVHNFRLEYWENDQWKLIPGTLFTDNDKRDLQLTFDPVVTTKVRFYSNEQIGRGIRLKEIEIYAPAEDVSAENLEATEEEGDGWNVDNTCYLTFTDEVTKHLQEIYYTGKVSFAYLDEGKGKLVLSAATHDTAQFGDYGMIASIDKADTGRWINATVEFTGDHIVMNHEAENGSDLVFSGDGRVRDVSIEFTTSRPAETEENPEVPPEEPENPETPPEEPENPEVPPEEPGDPEAPPEEPENPEVPPEEPGDPEAPPEEPENPEVPPEEPGDPEAPPEEPENPDVPPEEPGNPELPPEDSGNPEAPPQEPGNPDGSQDESSGDSGNAGKGTAGNSGLAEVKSPATGDDSHTELYCVILFAGLGLAVTGAVYFRRKRKRTC